MPELQVCNFCELFGFNSAKNPVCRLLLRINSDIYQPGFEFVSGSKYGGFEVANHFDDLALVYYDKSGVLVLHMFVPDGIGKKFANYTPEKYLYRYSKFEYLKDAMENGRFYIFPALEYVKREYDIARKDNEIVHEKNVPASSVKITAKDGSSIIPIGDVIFSTYFLPIDSFILCFSYNYDEGLYDEFEGSEACLVVQNVREFSRRIHDAFGKAMPFYLGIDGRVSYGTHQSRLGVLFSKPEQFIYQREYRFSWIPEKPTRLLDLKVLAEGNFDEIRGLIPPPIIIDAGSLSDITTIFERP